MSYSIDSVSILWQLIFPQNISFEGFPAGAGKNKRLKEHQADTAGWQDLSRTIMYRRRQCEEAAYSNTAVNWWRCLARTQAEGSYILYWAPKGTLSKRRLSRHE